MKKNAVIVGATGFGGAGLIDILLRHPSFRIHSLIDITGIGKPVSDIFPHLKGFCDLPLQSLDAADLDGADIAFFSTPDRAGMSIIDHFYDKKIPVIDFSGDFRFSKTDDYMVYAQNKGMESVHKTPAILSEAVYGLPELYSDRIRSARVVGNPGCFAISMILGLLPAVTENILYPCTIYCDGKTGVSGAGKNSGEANLYPQRHENMNPYREGRHQHLVEVESILNSENNGASYKIFFVPQIMPITRGILTTIYAAPSGTVSTKKLLELYRDYYNKSPFVRVMDSSPATAYVRGTNRCAIRPVFDERTGTVFITSVIDNLMKGQSGNAVQNANLMMGFDETLGLNIPAFFP